MLFLVSVTGSNGNKLKHRKVHLNVRKSCFTVRLAEHWDSLPWKVVESPSQEILKTCLDAALYTLQWVWSSWAPEVPNLWFFLLSEWFQALKSKVEQCYHFGVLLIWCPLLWFPEALIILQYRFHNKSCRREDKKQLHAARQMKTNVVWEDMAEVCAVEHVWLTLFCLLDPLCLSRGYVFLHALFPPPAHKLLADLG